MPIISMFYGIIIRMYLIDNQHHRTFTPNMPSSRPQLESTTVKLWPVSCRANNCGWFKHG